MKIIGMKTKRSLLTLFMVAFACVSEAQIYFQNDTDEPVSVAIGMHYDTDGSGYWGTEGWFVCDPGDKIVLSSVIGLNDNIYYYAKSTTSDKKYDGDTPLLVSTNAFSIKNADKDYQKDKHPEYSVKNFRHIDMNTGALQLKYTIILTY